MGNQVLEWDDLLAALDASPMIVDMHPVLYAFLPDEVRVVHDSAEASWLMDSPDPTLLSKMIIQREAALYRGRFPHVKCSRDPFSQELNRVMLQRFDLISESMLCQSVIADRILSRTSREIDVVVLMLVDGLGYEDARQAVRDGVLPSAFELEPSLVDVPTMTRAAFPNIVGSPPICVRLFRQGFYERLAFSYWTREDNALSDRIFQGFPHVQKTGQFDLITGSLREALTEGGDAKKYVQILRTGLDGYVHAQKRFPPVQAIVDQVFAEFIELTELCAELGARALLFLTADHGILWRNQFTPVLVGAGHGQSSPRYCGWREVHGLKTDQYRQFKWETEDIYCLASPYIRRELRIDEQGVHGGISYEESIVPLVSMSV
ncbi:MAG: hypothetical protein M5U05_18070 [Anaerolineales bacterium]|nr:hypothetical protein [Anaerolineales bacterium]